MASDTSHLRFTVRKLEDQREFDLRVMFDTVIRSDAIFIFGRDDLYSDMLSEVALYYCGGWAKKIVINGLTAKQCEEMNLAFPGCEEWLRILGHFGIRRSDVRLLPPSEHTALEAKNLMALAREMEWEKLIVTAVPYHIQRCMLQAIACMREAGLWLDISAVCSKKAVDWDQRVTKKLLGGGGETGSRADHAAAEVRRAIKYGYHSGSFISNGTYRQGIEYFKERNRRRCENKTG